MKKLLVLMLSALVLMSLTACAPKKETAEETKPEQKVLRVAGLNGGYGTAGWEAVAKAFEETTGVKVELTLEKNIADILRPSFQAGKDIPDVVYLSVGSQGGLTDTMIAEKQLTDISDLLELDIPGETVKVKDRLTPGFTDSFATKPYGDGKLYLAPINYTPCGLAFNAHLFEEKGWKVPTTFDEAFALAETAKAEGIALFTYPTTGYFDAFFSSLLNETAGPEVYNRLMNYDLEAWKLPEVKKAFEIVGELAKYTEENTVANANGEGFTKNQQLILDNKALFVPNGSWLAGEMKDAPRAEGFTWGFMALPAVTTDRYATTFTEQVWIPAGSSNVDTAKQFIAFLYSDKAVELFYKNGGAIMPTLTASKLLEGDTKAFYSLYDNGAKANAVGFAAHETVEGVDLTATLYGSVNSVVTGDKTVDDWYNDVLMVIEAYNK